jgi:hypothetical protein
MILIKKTSDKTKVYQVNDTYKFKVLFKNLGTLYDPDNISVEVTSPGGVVTNPNVTKVENGFYFVEVLLNEELQWNFKWTATKDAIVDILEYKINVKNYNDLIENNVDLNFNQLISVEVASGIKNSAGDAELAESSTFTFSTEYNPFYCSVEMLKVEMGNWLSLVPDGTIALAIHWASLGANNCTSQGSVTEEYFYARARFTLYDAAIKLFSMPISAEGRSGQSKQLGDLIIQQGSSLDYPLKDLISELKEERDEWWRIVNARGTIAFGQGLGPSSANKGEKVGLKRSREWHNPRDEYFMQPTQNSQYRRKGEKKYRHGFVGSTRGSVRGRQ